MIEPIGLCALALDAALGWPDRLYRLVGHPVGAFARIINACESRLNRSRHSFALRRFLGVMAMAMLLAISGGAALAIERAIQLVAGPWAWLLIALAAWPGLAQRSLDDHFTAVLDAIASGDLSHARSAVGMIVGRDTAVLDHAGVTRAAIESLAESFCDGVIAPLFWLLVLGLPGVWMYKAVNTADSLIGHPEEPLRAYGWAAARIDDSANFIPARISAVLICLAGIGGWRIMWRDHGKHASPNAGWPEAAMAGVLGIRLGGPVCYEGALSAKPTIGEGGDADLTTMKQARSVYRRACTVAWIMAGGIAWLG